MANQLQLIRLKQLGVKHWNQWIKRHPRKHIGLSGADLSSVNLSGADLSSADLSGANLNGADLSGANLSRANLSGADLRGASLRGASLQGANLITSDLWSADLRNAHLRSADLSGAHLEEVNLQGAELITANLSSADLSGADFHDADLSGANLRSANLKGVLSRSTIYGDIDLSTTQGLDTIRHKGPSTLGINTIYRSQGNIPDIFLRGCGVPDDMIAYVHSIAGAIQYYTVFISYSSKNRDFTQRLYNDLQGVGIRCWFDQRSLKGGDPFWEIIDQAIIQYDKVIVALSEDAILSTNVEREVQQALAREHDLQEHNTPKTVLFPITIDAAIKTTFIPWAANIQHSRHVIDFTNWKKQDDYQTTFAKLLDDLKTTN